MKVMYRVWWAFLGLACAALGGYLIVADPNMRTTGLICAPIGLAVFGIQVFMLVSRGNK
ncbi:hypothetical protein [Bremerella sp. P1]|uniref:hypothetical protein n=1 Tax=Bremerella sp. P1 TaxID=3026424 RepID=UPI0023680EF8|nr:hypothetical protein [Bremerella sp. P1]WDI44628.1 hypothetical protein PSR63_11850 [Bremerella sp. P1]